jgi:hypothetical protein
MSLEGPVSPRARKGSRRPVNYDILWKLALALPGVEESTSYGTPSFKVGGRFMARLKEDGESLVLKVGFPQREARMKAEPDVFYVTDHYLNYPSVLVHLSKVRKEILREVLEEAWQFSAPPKLRKAAR